MASFSNTKWNLERTEKATSYHVQMAAGEAKHVPNQLSVGGARVASVVHARNYWQPWDWNTQATSPGASVSWRIEQPLHLSMYNKSYVHWMQDFLWMDDGRGGKPWALPLSSHRTHVSYRNPIHPIINLSLGVIPRAVSVLWVAYPCPISWSDAL